MTCFILGSSMVLVYLLRFEWEFVKWFDSAQVLLSSLVSS